MDLLRIAELARHPDVPKFRFGSEELAVFHRRHKGLDGRSATGSGYYVVVHPNLCDRAAPPLRVLSQFVIGYCVPHSWDVPAGIGNESRCGVV